MNNDNTSNEIYLLKTLKLLTNDVKYVSGSTYEDIVWKTNATNIPTKNVVDAKVLELKNGKPLRLLRIERNQLLTDCDYKAMPDYPYSSDIVKQAWLTYRHVLRNLPSTASPQLDENGHLTNVTWPTPPS